MSASFKISLLFLLLIIPQHGNSPLPVMESWLQKDQDDGFVQRDLTSSLTGGDESFGSAHQTYQNSLIRKKESGNYLPATGYRKFNAKFDRNRPNGFFNARLNNDYNSADSDRKDVIFEDLDSDARLPLRPSNIRHLNNRPLNSAFMPKISNDVNIVPSKDVMLRNSRFGSVGDSGDNLEENEGRSAKWSMCKRLKARYASNPRLGYPALEQDAGEYYPDIDDDARARNELEEQNPQAVNEDEYYDAEVNPDGMNVEEGDYNQMLSDHGYMQKRDENQQPDLPNLENNGYFMKNMRQPSESLENDAISLEAVKEDMARAETGKARDIDLNKNVPNSDLVRKLNSNLQSKALHDVMRNSQRALQEVQTFQQKLALKSPEGNENVGMKRESRHEPLLKCNKKLSGFDEKRLKREDEDEQKNMKTGTDEGGGGEYEDEEGKGHKDEEEYYEDADLSDDESGNDDIRTNGDLNQRFVKREVDEDLQLTNSKEDRNENNHQDYELNLENAPVENPGKSRKSSLRGEGEKTKNNSARKGVKIWDQWGKWSPCSVTCGVGRSTRWRHCIGGGCAQGEKEAQIKKCTNPACR